MNSTLAINGGTPIREKAIPLNLPYFDQDDFEIVEKTLRSTMVSGDGPQCRAFEKELAAYLGVKHAFFTASCTAALDLAFMIKDFKNESEVIVPNFTFTSTALAPILNGLNVVLVDVYSDSGNINVSEIEKKITSKTVAIMPVDYAGNPAEMGEINDIAQRYGLYVVHDTAQSIGAEYKGRKTGTLADVSCFSFHGTKNLVVGEGGALVTDNDDLVERIIHARDKGTDKYKYLSDHEKKGYYEYVCKGNSYVQANILGALGLSQLRKIDFMNGRRRKIAEYYMEEFRSYDNIGLPRITKGAQTNWHLFYLLVDPEKKSWVIDALKAEGVTANIHYSPLHINRYYRDMYHHKENDFPDSMKFFESLVRIPIHQGMPDGDAEDVVRAVKKVLGQINSAPNKRIRYFS